MLVFRNSVRLIFKPYKLLIIILLELAFLRWYNTKFIHRSFSRFRYWWWDVWLVFFALARKYWWMLRVPLLLLLKTSAHILSWKAIAFFVLKIFFSKISGGVYLLLCLQIRSIMMLRFQSSLLQNMLIRFGCIALDFSS